MKAQSLAHTHYTQVLKGFEAQRVLCVCTGNQLRAFEGVRFEQTWLLGKHVYESVSFM